MSNTIAISGGHLTPALAVCEVLLKKEFRIIYLNDSDSKYEDANQIMRKMGIKVYKLNFGKWHRYSILKSLTSLINIPISISRLVKIILVEKVDCVLSFGGYQSVPLVIAAKICRIKAITHEQTLFLGLANKINSYLVDCVAVTNEVALKNFPRKNVVITGNPIRSKLLQNLSTENIDYLNSNILYVTGGHLGSKLINKLILSNIDQLTDQFEIYHSVGNHPAQQEEWEKSVHISKNNERYHPQKFFNAEELSRIYSKSNIVISRSGANTCWELARLNKPCILVPLAHGQKDEQLKNAQLLKSLGLAEIMEEKDIDGKKIVNLIKNMVIEIDKYKISTSDQDKFYPLGGDIKLMELVEKICEE